MVRFKSTSFGSVVIGGKSYGDILVVGEEVILRDKEKVRGEVGTDHAVGRSEVEKLLEGKPEVVIVGSGQSGVLRVFPEVGERFRAAGAEFRVFKTPRAILEFNRLKDKGRKVNALIHTTC